MNKTKPTIRMKARTPARVRARIVPSGYDSREAEIGGEEGNRDGDGDGDAGGGGLCRKN
jgi:hypothetical protein